MRVLTLALCLAAPAAMADDLADYRQRAQEWLLAGQRLPRDYRVELMAMESADRIRAIAYLRRIGLLGGGAWPLDDLLRDPVAPQTVPR